VETATSGRIEIGPNNSLTYIAEGKHSQLRSALPVLNSITTASDPVGAGYAAIGAVLEKDGDKGVLTITYRPIFASTSLPGGGGGASMLTDKWYLKSMVEHVPVERHQKYITLPADERFYLEQYFNTNDEATKFDAELWLNLNATLDEASGYYLALEFLDIKREGRNTFPFRYWEYVWVHQDSFLPITHPGNSIETPYGPGAGSLGTGLSWLRDADDLEADGGRYTITRKWTGVDTRILTWSNFLLIS
jgi:hypothetical protein